MSNWELLTKAQVRREYKYPEWLLDSDVASGRLAAFDSAGCRIAETRPSWIAGRYYIPRIAVERRIAEMAGMTHGE